MTTALHVGDCREILATLPAESVQCCVTSPPYFGLRDYGTASWDGGDPACDHRRNAASMNTRGGLTAAANRADGGSRIAAGRQDGIDNGTLFPHQYRDLCGKCGARRVDQQIGLEPSPQEYVDQLVAVFREVKRVLRQDGTLWLNLGDSYATGGGRSVGRNDSGKIIQGRAVSAKTGGASGKKTPAGCKDKDLMMIPARVALALQADGWWLRSDVIWSKPNPMPESCQDRPTSAHEHVFLLTKAERYFYDADAIAEVTSHPELIGKTQKVDYRPAEVFADGSKPSRSVAIRSATRNARNVWTIATCPNPFAHFAMMPPDLAERCIKAGTSEKGQCPCCGAPWVRVVEHGPVTSSGGRGERYHLARMDGRAITEQRSVMTARSTSTTGWSPSCACPEHLPVPQTVLDPFAGAGTTLLVADRLQRHGVGIELNAEYAAMAERRIRGDAPLFVEIAA